MKCEVPQKNLLLLNLRCFVLWALRFNCSHEYQMVAYLSNLFPLIWSICLTGTFICMSDISGFSMDVWPHHELQTPEPAVGRHVVRTSTCVTDPCQSHLVLVSAPRLCENDMCLELCTLVFYFHLLFLVIVMDFHWPTCFTPLESQITRSMYFQNINIGGKWYGN